MERFFRLPFPSFVLKASKYQHHVEVFKVKTADKEPVFGQKTGSLIA